MRRFDFKNIPLDVALRQLLLHLSLPRETQQIDRLIEAFAVQYEEGEPGLFVSKGRFVVSFPSDRQIIHTCWLFP